MQSMECAIVVNKLLLFVLSCLCNRRTTSSTSTAAADSTVERLPPPSPVVAEDPAVLTYKSAFVDDGTGEAYEGG